MSGANNSPMRCCGSRQTSPAAHPKGSFVTVPAVQTKFSHLAVEPASVDQQWGRLDILVNNAGISVRHPTMELSLADWNEMSSV